MKLNIIFILIMILIIPTSFGAYLDFGINDVIVSQSINSTDDLNFGLVLANNSSVANDINVTISILNPDNTVKMNFQVSNSVSANTISTFYTVILPQDLNIVYSSEPYAIFANITNETGGNPTNNTYKKYFTVKKGDKKIPVPDIPIVLGFVIALSIMFILARGDSIKKNIKKK